MRTLGEVSAPPGLRGERRGRDDPGNHAGTRVASCRPPPALGPQCPAARGGPPAPPPPRRALDLRTSPPSSPHPKSAPPAPLLSWDLSLLLALGAPGCCLRQMKAHELGEAGDERGEGRGQPGAEALRKEGDTPSGPKLQGNCAETRGQGPVALRQSYLKTRKRGKQEKGRHTAQSGCLRPPLLYPDPSFSLTQSSIRESTQLPTTPSQAQSGEGIREVSTERLPTKGQVKPGRHDIAGLL